MAVPGRGLKAPRRTNHLLRVWGPRQALVGGPASRRSRDLRAAVPASALGLPPTAGRPPPPPDPRSTHSALIALLSYQADQAYVVLAPGEGESAQQRLYLWAGDDAHKVRHAATRRGHAGNTCKPTAALFTPPALSPKVSSTHLHLHGMPPPWPT